MKIGVTGTRQVIPPPQAFALESEMICIGASQLHHGDCVGGDELAHHLAVGFGWEITIHPPTDHKHRAWCGIHDGHERWAGQITILPERPYIRRNHDIVYVVERLLVLPGGFHEMTRSGTWATYRFAGHNHVPRTLIYPDGKIIREESA